MIIAQYLRVVSMFFMIIFMHFVSDGAWAIALRYAHASAYCLYLIDVLDVHLSNTDNTAFYRLAIAHAQYAGGTNKILRNMNDALVTVHDDITHAMICYSQMISRLMNSTS